MNHVVQGKGNLLDTIREYNPDLTGEYIRIRGDDSDFARIANQYYDRKDGFDLILRSDATVEDGIPTFAGCFRSLRKILHSSYNLVSGEYYPVDIAGYLISDPLTLASKNFKLFGNLCSRFGLDEVVFDLDLLNRIKAKDDWDMHLSPRLNEARDILRYANFRGVDLVDARMDFILHKIYCGTSVLISEHPNIEGMIHVEYKIGNWESSDIQYPEELNKIPFKDVAELVKAYVDLIKQLRLKGKIADDYCYVAEGIAKPRKIVQLRPYFKKDITEAPQHIQIIGRIPKEGILFEYDDEMKGYPGLDIAPSIRSFINYYHSLPREIWEYNYPSRVIVTQINEGHRYLSHIGIINIEGVDTFDNSQNAINSFSAVNGSSKIRYFQKENGERMFEAVTP
ncbi:MAG: hypothetical protein ABIJ34_08000 [archaeon]